MAGMSTQMSTGERRSELGQQLRVDSVRMAAAAKSGHPTSAMSAADLMAVLVDGYLMFRYAENCGAAFGLLRDAPPIARKIVFGIAALAASIVLFLMFVRGRGQQLFAYSVPLIVSGALGNLIDRVRYGYVVDFIRFHLQDGLEWPTFNIADCGITVGVILLVLDGFREGRAEAKEPKAKEPKAKAATESSGGEAS